MSKPDFVILGDQHPDGGVLVIASNDLTKGELEQRADEPEFYYGTMFRPTPPLRSTVSAQMRDYVMVQAPSYAEAMRALFEQWTPEPSERPAVEQGQAQIERRQV